MVYHPQRTTWGRIFVTTVSVFGSLLYAFSQLRFHNEGAVTGGGISFVNLDQNNGSDMKRSAHYLLPQGKSDDSMMMP